jgi:transposase
MARSLDVCKQRHWLNLIQRWQRSRLGVREFCLQHALNEANFYVWRRVLRERGLLQDSSASPRATSAVPAFVELSVDAKPNAASSAANSAASIVDLVLSERRRLRIRPGFDADMLLKLVRLLEEPAC